MRYLPNNRIWRGRADIVLGLLTYFVMVLGPFFLLFAELVWNIPGSKEITLSNLIPGGRRWTLLSNSVQLAVSVAVTTIMAGFLTAHTFVNIKSLKDRSLYWTSLLALLPPYVHALAWMNLLVSVNRVLKSIGHSPVVLNGFAASWWIQTMAFLPLTTALAITGLKLVDRKLIEAAVIIRDDINVLFKIIIHLSGPMLLAASGIVFVLSITDYSVPSLFQYNVYALEIFAEYSSSGNYFSAMLVAIPLLIIALLVLLFSQEGIKNAALGGIYDNAEALESFALPKWYKGLQFFSGCLLATQFLVPLLMLVFKPEVWSSLVQVFSSSINEIKLTFFIALLAAVTCSFPAFCAAGALLKKRKASKLWWVLILLPVALPAPLAGIALINMWNIPAFDIVTNSVFMPVLGSVSRFIPFAILILLAQLRRVNPLLFDAAAVLQKNSVQTWLKIWLPLMMPGFLAAFCIVFILSFSELGATLLLLPPGQETLSIKIYNYMHYGASEKVDGLCLLVLLTVFTIGTLSIGVIRKGRT